MATPKPGHGQRPGTNSRAELSSRVSGERSTRQVEVARLQRELDDLAGRVELLERRGLMSSQLTPSFTVLEAEAAVALAEARLEATLARSEEDDEPNKVEIAASRLALVRATAQLRLSDIARTDGVLALETEIAYAKRRLYDEMQLESQLVRLVAKGYTSAEGLKKQELETAIARKSMERLLKRLELFKEAHGLPREVASQADIQEEPAGK